MAQTNVSNRLNFKAINSQAAFWIARANSPDTLDWDTETFAYSAAVDAIDRGEPEKLIGIQDVQFGTAFDCAMRIVAAVLSDPFGDPTPEIREAIEDAKQALTESAKDHARFEAVA